MTKWRQCASARFAARLWMRLAALLGLSLLLISPTTAMPPVVAASPPQLTSRDGEPVTGPVLLLFAASWCAPCYRELRDLPRLTAAAGGLRLIVVMVDTGYRAEAMTRKIPPAQLAALPIPAAKALMARLAPDNNGLPLTIGLDAKGAPCGVARKGLYPAVMAAWQKRCLRPD